MKTLMLNENVNVVENFNIDETLTSMRVRDGDPWVGLGKY